MVAEERCARLASYCIFFSDLASKYYYPSSLSFSPGLTCCSVVLLPPPVWRCVTQCCSDAWKFIIQSFYFCVSVQYRFCPVLLHNLPEIQCFFKFTAFSVNHLSLGNIFRLLDCTLITLSSSCFLYSYLQYSNFHVTFTAFLHSKFLTNNPFTVTLFILLDHLRLFNFINVI